MPNKRSLTSLASREIQIKAMMRYLLQWLKFKILTILSADKDAEQLGCSYTADGVVWGGDRECESMKEEQKRVWGGDITG